MTLIIAAEGKDFIIVGSDSLGTYGGKSGTNVGVNSNKLFNVSNHVVILTADNGEIGHHLIEKFKHTKNKKIDGVTNIANIFIRFCRKEFEHLKNFPISNDDFPGCVFIIAGLDKQKTHYCIPKYYVTMSYNDFMLGNDELGYTIQGKPMIARYLFKKYYEDPLTKERLILANDIATLVYGALYDVSEVAEDGGIGGDIKLAKIVPEGIRPFTESEKNNFKIEWINKTSFKKNEEANK